MRPAHTVLSTLTLAAALALTSAVAAPRPAHAEGRPQVWPKPREYSAEGDGFRLGDRVGLVTGATTDAAAVRAVRDALRAAGVGDIRESGEDPGTGVVVWFAGDPPVDADPSGLPPEGYALTVAASGKRGHIAIGGDGPGQFYAAQTLRQLIGPDGGLPGVAVRDWPGMAVRGTVEGFYGDAWSHAERLSHLDYLAAHKMNTYIYAPKNDPYHRARWREAYPAAELDRFGELAARARAGHVTMDFALSPGLSICFGDTRDADAVLGKFEALRARGVRKFTLAFDDIRAGDWHCDGDAAAYGSGGAGAGKAQADLLNRVASWARGKGLPAPGFVPTEYWGLGDTPYRAALRDRLDASVIVHWTGTAVIPGTVTVDQARRARADVGHDLMLWDNYPVNDYIAGRLPLGDYTGRERGLSGPLSGLVSNPANQPTVSRPGVFGAAAFAWNDAAYDPGEAWTAALAESGPLGPLKLFADVNTYDGTLHREQSPRLKAAIAAGGAELRSYASRLAAAPTGIRAGVSPAFAAEARAWLDATDLWAKALLAALDVLDDKGPQALSDRRRAVDAMTAARAVRDVRRPHSGVAPRVGDGVLDVFIAEAFTDLDRRLGIMPPASARSTMDVYGDNGPARMLDGDTGTYYWSRRAARTGDALTVDLGGVHRVGRIALLMGKDDRPGDFVHEGVLERSRDGTSWTRLTASDEAEVRADAGEAEARYIRYRATADNTAEWVVVREFAVTDLDRVTYTVTGGPSGDLRAAADGSLDTTYRGSGDGEGQTLTLTASRTGPLSRVTFVGHGTGTAEIRTGDTWTSIGHFDDYTELRVENVRTNAIRLRWSGTTAPEVQEVGVRW
ncbi:hypothetical protein Afil01_68260 [Actinorhabdospora filicis]|uniref:Hyaluronoglucosaminidase n=1 Tax=Actinorhabdospora filicis TaxID=1785913 RepID=A0A9W6SSE3_9ACTN|nr:beta-N-acetylglucosaminidase domain-containing protein [Actinorhabdospora filicis]GLZ82019.1 hypothetical protein Afil01_68260 [Actinorhabdospora filicis]